MEGNSAIAGWVPGRLSSGRASIFMFKKLFAPGNDSFPTSLALLTLRFWLGATMLMNHGAGKLKNYDTMASSFPDPLGFGHIGSYVLVVSAEFFASILLMAGLVTRFAALILAINMTVAFFVVHKAALTGEHSGELAFIYLAGYAALLLGGAGRISLDKVFFET
jgi:putative oxidoreductase